MPTTPPPAPAPDSLLSTLPLVFSAIAIFVTLANAAFTAYLQYFRRPKLDIIVSKWIRTWLGVDDHLALNIGITFVNSGAQYATITSVSGLLTSTSSNETLNIEWSKFIKFENAAPIGEKFSPHGSFAGWADHLVVPNRQAVAQSIQFFSNRPFTARDGHYRLKLIARSGTGAKSSLIAEAEVEFSISVALAEKLRVTRIDPDTKISKSAVGLATAHVTR